MIKKSPRACQIFCNASAAFFRYDCIAYLPTDSVPSLKIDHFHKILLFFYIRDNGKWVERNFNWHCTGRFFYEYHKIPEKPVLFHIAKLARHRLWFRWQCGQLPASEEMPNSRFGRWALHLSVVPDSCRLAVSLCKLNISFDFYRVCENTYKSWVRFFSESGTTMTWDIHALAHHVVISDFMDCNFKKSTGFSGRDVHHEMKPGGKRIFEKLRWRTVTFVGIRGKDLKSRLH